MGPIELISIIIVGVLGWFRAKIFLAVAVIIIWLAIGVSVVVGDLESKGSNIAPQASLISAAIMGAVMFAGYWIVKSISEKLNSNKSA